MTEDLYMKANQASGIERGVCCVGVVALLLFTLLVPLGVAAAVVWEVRARVRETYRRLDETWPVAEARHSFAPLMMTASLETPPRASANRRPSCERAT